MKILNGSGSKFKFKPSTYYVVEVAFNKNNPSHRSIFYSGFLSNDGIPSGYSCLFNPTYDSQIIEKQNIYYMDIISEIEVGEGDHKLK